MSNSLLTLATAALALQLSSLRTRGATLAGLWQLNGDMTNSVGGGLPLVPANWTPAYTSVTIAGQSATVLELPALAPAQTLGFANEIGANGGGTRTNSFSLAWDVNFRSSQTFESLLQTHPANGDDIDVFLESGRVIPMTGLEMPIAPNTWYRIVLTSAPEGANQRLKIYVNGTQISGAEVYPTDSRYTLNAATNFIFTDDNGETGDAYLNSFAVWNGPLTASEAAMLGAPTSTGIPEPATSALLLAAFAGFTARRPRPRGAR